MFTVAGGPAPGSVGVVVVGVVVVGVVVVFKIPDQYEASARIYVDTQSILKPLMAGLTVQPNVEQQISMLSRTLISRPNVEKLIRMADMDLKAASKLEQEALKQAREEARQKGEVDWQSAQISAAKRAEIDKVPIRRPVHDPLTPPRRSPLILRPARWSLQCQARRSAS